jgi:hypothetical protein
MSEIPGEAIEGAWRRALGILRVYQEYSTSAKRCVAALEILYDRLSNESESHRGGAVVGEDGRDARDHVDGQLQQQQRQ